MNNEQTSKRTIAHTRTHQGFKESKVDEDTRHKSLDHVGFLFKYIADKDIFQKYYSKLLSKRIIQLTSVSDEAEDRMLMNMKNVSGWEGRCMRGGGGRRAQRTRLLVWCTRQWSRGRPFLCWLAYEMVGLNIYNDICLHVERGDSKTLSLRSHCVLTRCLVSRHLCLSCLPACRACLPACLSCLSARRRPLSPICVAFLLCCVALCVLYDTRVTAVI